jgi:hypothetical protein
LLTFFRLEEQGSPTLGMPSSFVDLERFPKDIGCRLDVCWKMQMDAKYDKLADSCI